jgi:2-oxoglutarate dehydrogenase E2 component (dihydrolipoamide succinyltransferase)
MDFRKQHLDAFVKRYGVKIGFMSAFCKATAYALQDQPVVNAVIEENVRKSSKNQLSRF